MSRMRTERLGWTLAVAVALLYAAANLFAIESLWGFNFAIYLPPVWLYIGLGLIVVSFLPQSTALVLSIGNRLTSLIGGSGSQRRLVGITAAIVFGALCWYGSVGLPLLGDGSLRCREITDGKLWQPTEMLDFLLHALTYTFVTKPLHLEVTQAYRYLSIFSGVIFLLGAYKLTRYVARDRWLTWIVAALGLGITVQFFGYVESYSIAAALVPWLVWSGIRVADGKSSPFTFAVFVIIAGLFHSVMLLLFGASAVLLLIQRSENTRKWVHSHMGWLWGAGAIVFIAMLVGKLIGLPFVSTYVVPLLPSASDQVALLSIAHLLNIVNWILLSSLAILLLIPAIRQGRSDVEFASRRVFVFSLIIPAVIFVILFPAQLGGPIDWDLFSLPLAVVVFALLTLVENSLSLTSSGWLLPIFVVALINTASFVAVNHSITASAERFNRIIPLSASPNPWIHWSSLVVHAEHQPALYDRRNEFLLKSWQAPPKKKRDSILTLTKLMHEAVAAKDSLSARTIVGLLNNISDLPPEVLSLETDVFLDFGSREEQQGFAEMLVREFASSPIALGAAGLMYLNLGDMDRCGVLLARSYDLDSTNFRVCLSYGVYLSDKQDFSAAASVLKRALKLDGNSFFAAYYLSNCCLALGDVSGAKEAMLRAEANALRPEEQERIKQLKMRF